jgi:hypothetical protein
MFYFNQKSEVSLKNLKTSRGPCLGLGTEFCSEKITRNRLGTVSVIPRKKVLIPRHSEFRGRANFEARKGTERKGIPRKMKFYGTCTAPMITLTVSTF